MKPNTPRPLAQSLRNRIVATVDASLRFPLRGALLSLLGLFVASPGLADEQILGRQILPPGIQVVVEAAIRDRVLPVHRHLSEADTDVHLEVLATWDEKSAVPGAVAGGFIPLLDVTALIRNQRTGKTAHASLVPHINLIDNFHYARNLALPGNARDRYEVTIELRPPGEDQLAVHRDWLQRYGIPLFAPARLHFNDVSFAEVVGKWRPGNGPAQPSSPGPRPH